MPEAVQYIIEILANAWAVVGEMAPYLLFGFFMAGLLSVFISPEWVERHLGGKGLSPIAKSVFLGIPLPLCSCGVIPVTASMRNHGAGRGATVGFLLATPQTGVDSIVATWGMLGPVFGIFRPVAALVTGLIGGALEDVLVRGPGGQDAVDDTVEQACSAACCDEQQGGRFVRALRYGFVTLPADIGKALLAGILVAGLIAALVPHDSLEPYLGGGILAMLLMIIVGVPIYVCSTASIPIALGFMHMGASPGAALAFLIAGPATNAATIAMVWKVLGRASAAIYLGTAAGGALVCGLLLDALYAGLDRTALTRATHIHEMGISAFDHVLGAVLVGIILFSLLPRRVRARAADQARESTGQSRSRVTLEVQGMKCSHCSDAVTRALREIEGVQSADVDLGSGRVSVQGKGLAPERLRETIDRLGYQAQVIDGSA